MQPSEYWPTLTVHREYWERSNCAYVYEYDPTDDGPETEVITSVRVNHPTQTQERAEHKFNTSIMDAVAKTLKDPAIAEAMRLRGVRL